MPSSGRLVAYYRRQMGATRCKVYWTPAEILMGKCLLWSTASTETWFRTRFQRYLDPKTGLVKVLHSMQQNVCTTSIVPVADIVQYTDLVSPLRSASHIPRRWSSCTVLKEGYSWSLINVGDDLE
jgi:hypothetical protein